MASAYSATDQASHPWRQDMPAAWTSSAPVSGCSTAVVAVNSQSASTTQPLTAATVRASRPSVATSR